jgi:alpha-L-fucosidase
VVKKRFNEPIKAMKKKSSTPLLCLLIAVAGALLPTGPARAAEPATSVYPDIEETNVQRDARMKWWREARFGMFVHWGLFSAAGCTWKGKAGGGCWLQSSRKIPAAEYREVLMPKFTGERFDPAFIAQLAKDAGMKYIVPITKHHEGFCLFHSKHTDFKITNTPAKRDWIRELADASRERGLKVGFYYSQSIDWHHPGGGWAGDASPPWDPAHQGDTDRYVDSLVIPQLKELLSDYGEVSIMWFDIPTSPAMTPARAKRIADTVRSLRPDIVMNNRLGPGIKGDIQTPEQVIPPTGLVGQDWETCQTINNSWEYTHYDRSWKSPTTLVRELIDTVSKGGNYLLNIGPKPDGTVPQSSIDTLRAIGGWMKVHSDSIYGTTASPFPRQLPWGRCTQKDLGNGVTRLYLHIFRWPFDSILRVPALDNEILNVALLSEPDAGPLDYTKDTNGDLLIQLPISEPNDYATVVSLDVKGAPSAIIQPIHTNAKGILELPASLALIQAASAITEIAGFGEKTKTLYYNPVTQTLDSWINPEDRAFWPVSTVHPGEYFVDVNYIPKESGESFEYFVELGKQRIAASANTTGAEQVRTDRIGVLKIDKTDRSDVAIRLSKRTEQEAIKVRSITLIPISMNQ